MPKAENKKSETIERPFFEEWDVRIKIVSKNDKSVPEYEKLKLARPKVLITEEQANVLNDGVLYGGNNYAVMYFKPE